MCSPKKNLEQTPATYVCVIASNEASADAPPLPRTGAISDVREEEVAASASVAALI